MAPSIDRVGDMTLHANSFHDGAVFNQQENITNNVTNNIFFGGPPPNGPKGPNGPNDDKGHDDGDGQETLPDPSVPQELEDVSREVEQELKDAIESFMSKGHAALAPLGGSTK